MTKSLNSLYYTLLLAFFVMTSGAQSQNKVIIYGKIMDESGLPIELVAVSLHNAMRGTTSDSNGNFEMEHYKTDSVILIFSRLGYQSKSLTVPCQKDYKLDVQLNSTAQHIETVVVEEDRMESVRMNKLDAKVSSVIPDASGSGVEALITTLPGVSTTNEMSSQYAVRGGNFDENLVYVNGIEVYRPILIRSGKQEGLSFINPDLVANIAFSSGGFDAQYGDKMSSVLDITYRTPTAFAASASVGLLGASAHVENISKNQKFTQLHGIRYKTAKYLLNTLDTDGDYDPTFVDYQTLLRYRLSNNWSVSFLGNYAYNQYTFIPQTRLSEYGTFNDARALTVFFDGWENDVFRTMTGALSLNYTPSLRSDLRLTFSSFQTNESESYDILGEYWLDDIVSDDEKSELSNDSLLDIGVGGYMQHARNELKVNVNALSFKGVHSVDQHLLSWGTTFQLEKVNDNINEWLMRDSAGYSQPYSSSQLKVYNYYNTVNDVQSLRVHGYVQDAFKADKLSLNVGLRYSYWSFNNELNISPRASLVYAPDNDHYWRFAMGRYVQAPFYKEIRDRSGNVNDKISAQKSYHFVVAYDYFFKLWQRPFKYTFETYYKHMNDLIPYDVDNVQIRYYGKNMSKGYAVGVESRIFGEFVPGVDSWLGLSLMKTAEKLDGHTNYVRRPTDQRYNFTMFFQDYLPGNPNYKTHLRMIFGGGLPFGAPNASKENMTLVSRPYQRVDWGLSRLVANNKMASSVLKKLWLDLEVLNLFGIKNTNSYFWVQDIYGQQYPIPNYLTGRRFNIKITAEF